MWIQQRPKTANHEGKPLLFVLLRKRGTAAGLSNASGAGCGIRFRTRRERLLFFCFVPRALLLFRHNLAAFICALKAYFDWLP